MRQLRLHHLLLTATLSLWLAACSKSPGRPTPELRGGVTPVSLLLYAAELDSAGDRAIVDGREYLAVKGDAWRDFMPNATGGVRWSDGASGLAVAMGIMSDDGQPMDSSLVPLDLVVIQDGLAWIVPADRMSSGADELWATAFGGPAWNPDTFVDIALVLQHDWQGLVILRVDRVKILRPS